MTVSTDICDIQVHLQNFMGANNNWIVGRIWPAGRGVDTPALGRLYDALYERSSYFKNC